MSTVFACTALNGVNKTGNLKPDASGYYTLVLGALGIENSMGDVYDVQSGEKCLKSSPDLLARINEGKLRAEWGHPLQQPGQTRRDYFLRLLRIEEKNVCAHIREFQIDDSGSVKDKNGQSIVSIIGKVKPEGPYGQYLAEQLENPHANCCFSIRSFTRDIKMPNGRYVKHLDEVVTWDAVNDCGLKPANKFDSPALEHLYTAEFNKDIISSAKKHLQAMGTGMENSSEMRTINRLLGSRGWVEPVVGKTKLVLPPSAAW